MGSSSKALKHQTNNFKMKLELFCILFVLGAFASGLPYGTDGPDGAFNDEDENDLTVLAIAREAASNIESGNGQCHGTMANLILAESQVVSGTNWHFVMDVDFVCDLSFVIWTECRDVYTHQPLECDLECGYCLEDNYIEETCSAH